jgi:hypothetical protein
MAAPSGVVDIDDILKTLDPTLLEPTYLFASLPKAKGFLGDFAALATMLDPVSTVVEAEGLSFIVAEDKLTSTHLDGQLASMLAEGRVAEGLFDPQSLVIERAAPMRMISLTVHSSLTMCGLTAALSGKMADAKISCNVPPPPPPPFCTSVHHLLILSSLIVLSPHFVTPSFCTPVTSPPPPPLLILCSVHAPLIFFAATRLWRDVSMTIFSLMQRGRRMPWMFWPR